MNNKRKNAKNKIKNKEEIKMELKGSKTEKNLMEAFAGESQARNKYTYFASKAKKEGYEQIAAIFQDHLGDSLYTFRYSSTALP